MDRREYLRHCNSYTNFESSLNFYLEGEVIEDRVCCGQSWKKGVVGSQVGFGCPGNLRLDANSNIAIEILSLRPSMKY